MTNEQQQACLRRIHSLEVNEISHTDVSVVTVAISKEKSPLLKAITDAGVDWIPIDILSQIASKAAKLEVEGNAVSFASGTAGSDIVIVPSTSDPTKPHTVNIDSSGKAECQNCHGYKSCFICAHVIVACRKKARLKEFLRWLVTKKRKTGGCQLHRSDYFWDAKRKRKKGKHSTKKTEKTQF